MKKIHYIGIIIIVIASLIFFFYPKHTENKTLLIQPIKKTVDIPTTATAEERLPQTKEITYTDEGFSPAVLSISSGDTVIFKNKSNKDFRPIGNAQNKISFGATTTISKNNQYEFTFKTSGEYGYYDQLDQSKFGAIVIK